MCHVIVTSRSMLWTLLSIIVAFTELIAFMSSNWLVGLSPSSDTNTGSHVSSEPYRPTLGLYGRCLQLSRGVQCGPYASHFGEIASGFWQATSIFLALGILLLCCVAIMSVFTLCFQSIMKKSIFNICGLLQGIAAAGEVQLGPPDIPGFSQAPSPEANETQKPSCTRLAPYLTKHTLDCCGNLWSLANADVSLRRDVSNYQLGLMCLQSVLDTGLDALPCWLGLQKGSGVLWSGCFSIQSRPVFAWLGLLHGHRGHSACLPLCHLLSTG